MSTLDIILLSIMGGAIILGAIIFFLAGVYKVKENKAMVIEKAEKFYGVYTKGLYFFMPIVYKRKGVYTLVPMERDIYIEGLRDMVLTYQVIDVEKYHYYDGDVSDLVRRTYEKFPDLEEEILIDELNNIGIKYISIRAK